MSESRLHLCESKGLRWSLTNLSEEFTYIEPTYSDITIEEHSKLLPPKPTLPETYGYTPKLEESLLAIYISTYGQPDGRRTSFCQKNASNHHLVGSQGQTQE